LATLDQCPLPDVLRKKGVTLFTLLDILQPPRNLQPRLIRGARAFPLSQKLAVT
jgi:hypothetical protein